MVHTERTDKCPSNSPSAPVKSQPASSSYKSSSDSSYRSGSSSSSSHKIDDDKWKYNRMVKDDRDKFNNLHHC